MLPMTNASLKPAMPESDNALRTITRALISVSDKAGIVEIARQLHGLGVEIISTGGTAKLLKEQGVTNKDISEHTGFPEMLDGRVKTLHPKVHGGILGIRENSTHQQAMDAHAITPIDLVIVNLYPFEATVAKGADFEECIENIDIGGPSMVRSAAKNHHDVAIITDPADYARLAEELAAHNGATTLAFRRYLAAKAFARTAAYDAAIGNWFATQEGEMFPERLTIAATRKQVLRYGENPDQLAAVYSTSAGRLGVVNAEQLQGKELSYNNFNDTDAALELVAEFSEPTVAIIKHANPCGIASASTIEAAYEKALACDPVSAFGGIIALNRPLTKALAEALSKMFVEVIIAPGAEPAARELMATKKNLRLLLLDGMPDNTKPDMLAKSIAGGLLLQQRDTVRVTQADLQVVTKRAPTEAELADLLFGFTVCKHVKSNAIVFAKNQTTIGIGAGQMSRVDSVRIASLKASDGEGNDTRAKGAVVASDAFFPFADGLLLAAQAGITAAIQPGGSVRDEEVIAAADAHGMAMVFTGKRHFKH
jgi:phosphoribosylaminoimidazolecarboxamide formyltransferase/IMP cyclohydrolase